LAEADHVSVDRLAASLVLERMGECSCLQARRIRDPLADLNRVLSQVPNVEPESYDRI
jgi:hypothetical protein